MNLQQGVFFLADSFKSFSKTATGSNTAVYTVPTANEGAVPPVLPTTAIVKSIRLSNQTGSNTAVYTVPTANEGAVPPVLPTTAIVKSVRLSNQTGGAVTTTVAVLDYDASSPLEIELYKDSLADGAEAEILTHPVVLEQQDAVKILGNGVKILVSLMEIT